MTTPQCHEETCITCADQLLRVVVQSVDGSGTTAHGLVGDTPCEVSVELLDGVRPGDVLLAHGGVALQRAADTEATP